MNILDEIFKPIFGIILLFVVVYILKDITYFFNLIKTISNTKRNLQHWKEGYITLDDINSLTPREFEYWCGEFISNIGYSSIKQSTKGADGGKDILCKFHGETCYVECKRYWYDSSAPYKVDKQICKKLAGAMIHDHIPYGLVITSGMISDGCKDYIRSLPIKHKIKLIDGAKIIELYTMLHSKQHSLAASNK